MSGGLLCIFTAGNVITSVGRSVGRGKRERKSIFASATLLRAMQEDADNLFIGVFECMSWKILWDFYDEPMHHVRRTSKQLLNTSVRTKLFIAASRRRHIFI